MFIITSRKLGDGLFLNCCRNVAKEYPEIEFNDMIIDNASMQVGKPCLYKIKVTSSDRAAFRYSVIQPPFDINFYIH